MKLKTFNVNAEKQLLRFSHVAWSDKGSYFRFVYIGKHNHLINTLLSLIAKTLIYLWAPWFFDCVKMRKLIVV